MTGTGQPHQIRRWARRARGTVRRRLRPRTMGVETCRGGQPHCLESRAAPRNGRLVRGSAASRWMTSAPSVNGSLGWRRWPQGSTVRATPASQRCYELGSWGTRRPPMAPGRLECGHPLQQDCGKRSAAAMAGLGRLAKGTPRNRSAEGVLRVMLTRDRVAFGLRCNGENGPQHLKTSKGHVRTGYAPRVTRPRPPRTEPCSQTTISRRLDELV